MLSYPHPLNHQDFETLTVQVAETRLRGSSAVPNGRNGQKQKGVDVVVTMPDGTTVGMQCKWKGPGKELSLDEIQTECELAKDFKPSLTKLYVCTTAEPDSKLQEKARALSYSFAVEIWAWDTFNDTLNRSDAMAQAHLKGAASADRAGFERAHARRLREALDRPAFSTPVWAEGSFELQLEGLDATLAFLRTGRLYDGADEFVRDVFPMSHYEGEYLTHLNDLDSKLKRMRTSLLKHMKAIKSSEYGVSFGTADSAESARLKVVEAGSKAVSFGGA